MSSYLLKEVHEWLQEEHRYTASVSFYKTKVEAKVAFFKKLYEYVIERDWLLMAMCEDNDVNYDTLIHSRATTDNFVDRKIRRMVAKYVDKGSYLHKDGEDIISYEIIKLGSAESLDFSSEL